MKSNLFTLLITLFALQYTFAQTIEIKAKVVDKADNTPLIGVGTSLILISSSNKKVGALTDTNGVFKFSVSEKGTYTLNLSYIGYQDFTKQIRIDKSINLGTIEMLTSTQVLNEVTVAGKQVRVEQKGDTLSYNAGAYKVNQDASAEDLIKKMPGVTIENGQVKAQGEAVKKVMLDGKEFFGDDAMMALKNLPAEIIDKVQVFDRMSEQAQFTGFNDGNTDKTINITTKSGKSNGQFGKVYGGYGTDDRYSTGGNVNYFKKDQRISVIGMSNNINQQNFASEDLLGVLGTNANTGGNRGGGGNGGGGNSGDFLTNQQNGITGTNAIGINYTDNWGKKIKFTGSYFFNQTGNENLTNISRVITAGRTLNQLYDEIRTTNNQNYNNRINLRFDYTIDKKNSILFTPRISFQGNSSSSIVNGKTSFGDSPINEINTNNLRNSNGFRLGGDLMFRHKFAKFGRTISINFNLNNNTNNRNDTLKSLNKFFSPSRLVNINQAIDNDTESDAYGLRISYTEQIKKKGQLEMSYQLGVTNSNTDRKTLNFSQAENSYSLLDTNLTNQFENQYLNNRIGLSFRVGGFGGGDFGGGMGGRGNYSGGFGGQGNVPNPNQRNQQLPQIQNQPKLSYGFGFNIQNAQLVGNQLYPRIFKTDVSFNNLLPNANIRYQFNKSSNIRLFYRTQTVAPTIAQLQNVVDNSNQLFFRTGNPNLKQEYSHSLNLRFNTTNLQKAITFFAFVNANLTNDNITNATFVASKDTLINGILLRRGGQLSKPVNLDGNYNISSFLSLGLPVTLIKSNLNFNGGLRYVKTPGLINNLRNNSNNYVLSGGLTLSSNINENIDFTATYMANYNIVKNEAAFSNLDNNFYFHTVNFNFNYQSKKGFITNTLLNQYLYTGLSDGFNQNFTLCNLSFGQKLFAKQRGELKVTIFDIFGQNNSITRNITETYIEDVRSLVLTRYFMFTFTYNIRNFR